MNGIYIMKVSGMDRPIESCFSAGRIFALAKEHGSVAARKVLQHYYVVLN